MPILERDALQARTLLSQKGDELGAERAAGLARILSEFKAQQERNGEPLFPSEERQKRERATALRRLFQDRERHGLDKGAFEQLQAEAGKTLDPEATRYRAINRQFFSDLTGETPEALIPQYDSLRDAYARKQWGMEKTSDKAFFSRLADEFDREEDVLTKASKAAIGDSLNGQRDWMRAYSAAGFDENAFPDKFQAWEWREKFRLAYDQTEAETAHFAPEAKAFVDALQRSMTGGATDGDDAILSGFRERLIDAPKDERDSMLRAITVYGATVGESVTKGDAGGANALAPAKTAVDGWFQQAGESAARIVRGMAAQDADLESALSRVPLKSAKLTGPIDSPEAARKFVTDEMMLALGESKQTMQFAEGGGAAFIAAREMGRPGEWRDLTPEERTLIETEKARVQRSFNVAREIEQIAQSTDPIKSVTAQTVGSSGALMLASAVPGGWMAAVEGYRNLNYNRLRLENPDMKAGDAAAISLASGAVEAALDRLSVSKTIFPALPRVREVLTGGMSREIVKRVGTAGAVGFAFENAIEGAQDLTTPLAQSVFSALKEDVPGVDWDSEWEKWWGTRGDVALGMLPLTLMGMGIASARDVRNARGLLSNVELLRASGLGDTSVEVVDLAARGKVEESARVLAGAWQSRNAASAEAFAKIEADQQQRMDAFTRLSEAGILPGMRRTNEGWALTFQDGTLTEFGSHADADAARWEYASNQSLAIAEEMRRTITDLERQLEPGREVVYEFSPERMDTARAEAEGLASREALQQRVDVGRALAGEFSEAQDAARVASVDAESAQVVSPILGMNQSQWVEGIQRTVIKLYQGASPLTIVEEKLEADVSRMMKTGRAPWLIAALREYERVSGDTLFRKGVTDDQLEGTDIREAYSHLGTSYFVGKSRRENSPALTAKGFRKLAADMMRTKLGGVLTAYGHFFRSVFKRAAKLRSLTKDGKLNPELEAELARSLGIGDEQQEQVAQEKEAERLATELADTLQYNPSEDAPFSMLTPRTELVEKGEGYQKLALPDGATLEGPASFSILAYHGTPHKVGRFSLDKIGTGEGAQAYGWGLYFAESDAVAQSYKRPGPWSHRVPTTIDGVPANIWKSQDESAMRAASALSRTISAKDAIEYLEQDTGTESAVEWIKANLARIADDTGNLYTVELDAAQEDFLDWDKPLLKQSGKVKAALKSSGIWKAYNQNLSDFGSPQNTRGSNRLGSSVYEFTAWSNGSDYESASRILSASGIRGIRYLDGNSRDGGSGTYNYVIFDESLVKIIAENGRELNPEEAGFSAITPAQDSEYLQAVEAGDMATAQRMVDAAAWQAEFEKQVVHQTHRTGIQKFDRERGGVGVYEWDNIGIWTTTEDTPRVYGPINMRLMGRLKNPKRYRDLDAYDQMLRDYFEVAYREVLFALNSTEKESDQLVPLFRKEIARLAKEDGIKGSAQSRQYQSWLKSRFPGADGFREHLKNQGYDGIQIDGAFWDGEIQTVRIFLEPNQLKSADPVTYDESGAIIPLSQRFNPERDEISFSALPRNVASDPNDFEARLARMFDPFQRSPELRQQIGLLAQQRAIEAIRKWQPIAAIAGRTKADIDRERKARIETGIAERVAALDQSVFEALAIPDELLDPRDYPVFDKLLRRKTYKRKDGKTVGYWAGMLESPSAYMKRTGKTRAADEYDGMGDLPGWVFGGSLTPDEAADMVGVDGTNALWDEIHRSIDSAKLRTQERDAAQAEVDRIEGEARAEANEWAAREEARLDSVATQRENLTGAIRTLNAMISALPPEVRGKIGGFVTLSKKVGPAALLRELMDRAGKMESELEAWLRKDIDRQVFRLLEKAKPAKDKAGKKKVGKAGADIHSLFDEIRAAIRMDATEAEAQAVALETKAMADDATAEQEAHYTLAASMVRLFGDWRNADAARRSAAHDAAKATWEKGYLEWQTKKRLEREQREEIRQALIVATGSAGTAGERDKRMNADNGFRGFLRKAGLNLLPFEGVIRYAFGDASPEAQRLADMEREASNQKDDAMFAAMEEVDDLFAGMAGGRLAGERLRFNLAQKSVIVGDRTMSQLEMLQAVLMWRQPDGQRHMIGQLDESGKPVGKWHYGAEFMAEVEAKLSSEAREVLAFISDRYAAEWETLNPIYAELNGVNLPRNANYAPLTVKPMTASAGDMVDPVTGSASSSRSSTPGSLRSRGVAIAEPDFRDALQTYVAHRKQMEHWKAYARFSRDARAVLGNRNVSNSVSAINQEAATVLKNWIDDIEAGGNRDAAAHLTLSQGISAMTNRAAAMGVVGRIGTIALQATQLMAASAEMPPMAFWTRFGALMAGRLNWLEVRKYPYIQRRIKQMPPIVQQAMEGFESGKPNAVKYAARQLAKTIPGADGFFTAGTFAIVLDYQRSQLLKSGFPAAEAERRALVAAERITDRVAQPTRLGARSLLENRAGTFMRLIWAFSSEARKNVGIMLGAIMRGNVAETARGIGYVVVLNGVVGQFIRSAMRDLRDDDDEDLFDEKHWNPERLGLAVATDWLYGIPVIGDQLERAAYKLAGEYVPEGSLFREIQGAIPALYRLDELAAGELESEEALRDLETIITAMGYFNDTLAGAASFAHLIRDAAGIAENVEGPN